ncbi:hypothetical protein MGG_09816 [Pyricularia oryzae 70-15]|uniref:ZN622/Rei1/Reh1 zinc finger C2H2-type domain-containing protein n=3 Tax=Pyricularia oryzae TaxID=318829 RepID=G4NIJ8_PYRO7|nr:uncharacterized protein MGG_09816 [Pyricularia oryzae 70-15]EHA48058.1 hypothetical protein MGG_09816 [Pyricularia oryzae 70-15]ELQ40453.1 hypothetical protein OOU_Y34scaffold00435g21 [Pyricularia oryzae Y34]KAI7913634.1 hypothetical protein M0657_009933 [Pyricularia oryzae]
MVGGGTTGSGSGSGASSPSLSSTTSPTDTLVFNHEQCLFCNKLQGNFEANMAHMRLAHGLMIPATDRLAVDLETLFSYLHLVVSGYNECLCCGTQRNTTEAAQQHMMDKGHCRFDIADGSEYADFYDSSTDSEAESDAEGADDDDNTKTPHFKTENAAADPDEKWLRLPSGRVIHNRAGPAASSRSRRTRTRSTDQTPAVLQGGRDDRESQAPRGSTGGALESGRLALSKADRRVDVIDRRFADLRSGDQLALAHLGPAERRAVVAMRQRETERVGRVESRYRLRVEGLGNVFLMTHFRKDAADKRTLYR